MEFQLTGGLALLQDLKKLFTAESNTRLRRNTIHAEPFVKLQYASQLALVLGQPKTKKACKILLSEGKKDYSETTSTLILHPYQTTELGWERKG